MRKYIVIVFILILALVALLVIAFSDFKEGDGQNIEESVITTNDVLNMEYIVDGERFLLKNGMVENLVPVEGVNNPEVETGEGIETSLTQNLLMVYAKPLYADFDLDGDEDAALWLVNDPGGSGEFYYAVLAINSGTEYSATNALFLGDRIMPVELQVVDNHAVYKYKERGLDEPFTAEPTREKELWIRYDKNTNSIGEWVKNFEGEADPNVMKLDMKTWHWQSVTYNDGKQIIPKDPVDFTISFYENNTFSASTDCNGIGGSYEVEENRISFSDMLGTLMYCDGAQEDDFRKILESASLYSFTSKGELVLDLKYDSGSAIFR